MKRKFHSIGLVGNLRHPEALDTYQTLYGWLKQQEYSVIVEREIAEALNLDNKKVGTLEEIGGSADLAVVIGGDGNMLSVARVLAQYDIDIIGVNRGKLGFLTDLDPNQVLQQLAEVLAGEYFSEHRFLLEAEIYRDEQVVFFNNAVNEVVLHSGKVAHMIEFEVYIDEHFAFSQRADGLIISTPTGSTAYSLSGGGPILMPTLNAIALVPMFPHTMSARPLVIGSDSLIRLRFAQSCRNLEISCDSQIALPIQIGDEIVVRRSQRCFRLIHPKNYNYFNTLSTKLGWSRKLF